MDIEQLKLILSTVGNAADGARDFAITWLVIEAGKSLLGYAIGAAIILALYKVILRIVSAVRECCDIEQDMRAMRDAIHPDEAGTPVSWSERKKMAEELRKAYAAKG